jgi:hypothetical protein
MQSLNKYTKLSMTCSDHLTWKGTASMKIWKNKKIVHLITSFNQLHDYQAIRSTYHKTLQATSDSCQLVFGRQMIHNIAFRANWDQIQKRKEDIINKSNQKENKINSQVPYEYKVGVQVLLENTWDSPEIVNTLYRTISCNECIQEWYNQSPKKMKCTGKIEYPQNHSIQSKAQLSMILGANDIP